MVRRRYISLLLLAVYLLATGGVWLLSLTCGCADAEHASEHTCSTAGYHAGHDHDAADEELCAACTCGLHSTEITLYTAAHGDDEKTTRCAVTLLPPSLAAECPCPAHVPALRRKPLLRPAPLTDEPLIAAAGLRAPPVSA